MIIPMRKYSFLVYHKDYINFLNGIQELGVLHIIEKQSGEIDDEELKNSHHKLNELNNAIKFLNKFKPEETENIKKSDGWEKLTALQRLQSTQNSNELRLSQIKKEINLVTPWGNFDWKNIKRLEEQGLRTLFLSCTSKRFNPKWEEDYYISKINEITGVVYFVVFLKKGETITIDADEIRLPENSLSELETERTQIESELEKAPEDYKKFSAEYWHTFEEYKKELISSLDFKKVILNTQKEADEKLMLLEGWVPKDVEDNLIICLEKYGVYYIGEDPAPQDKTPIKLKNNRFAKLFEPIGELYSLPNYYEFDLTALFAPFFMLFFGFCLGDAGYGLFILILVSIIKWRTKNIKLKPMLTLAQFLGISTVIMGFISGTFFGIPLLDTGYVLTSESVSFLTNQGVPNEITEKVSSIVGQHYETRDAFFTSLKNLVGEGGLKEYRSEFMRSSFSDYKIMNYFRHLILDSQQLFYLALIIGLFQIIFGLCVKAHNLISFKGFKYALSTVGWIILIISLITIFGLDSANKLTEGLKNPLLYSMLGVSGFLIFIFNDPDSNPVVSSLKGIWDAYGMISGVFGDTLSYIRLFALGTSGAILGFVFNTIGLQILQIPYAGPVLFVIFLIFGHGLTIGLSVLGAFVHPMRLTFVEFYKNAGFTGGGKAYKPFKIQETK